MGSFSFDVAWLKCPLHNFFLTLLYFYTYMYETPANSSSAERCKELCLVIFAGAVSWFQENSEIGDITIEKYGCQIKISYDTM